MTFRVIPRVIRRATRNPALVSALTFQAARSALHPLERHLLGGRSLPPRSVSIMITDRCNLRCRMCHYSYCESPEFSLNQDGFMSREVFHRILDTLPGRPLIGLTGGEPLLHRDLVGFITEMKRRGLFCSVTTNGTFLEPRAEDLARSGLDVLVVSIDGDEAIHDRIRGRGAFARAVAGLQAILRLSDRPLVGMSTVINDLNHGELEGCLALAESLGVDLLNFNQLWIQTDEMIQSQEMDPDLHASARVSWHLDTEAIDPQVVFEALESIRRRKRKVLVNTYPDLNRRELETYYRQPETLVKVRHSRCAWQVLKVYPDGDVGICREYRAGSVRDQPLEEIWNNPRYRKFRRFLSEKGTCPICSRCCLLFTRV